MSEFGPMRDICPTCGGNGNVPGVSDGNAGHPLVTAPTLDARLEELAAEVRVNFTIPDPAEVRADIRAALTEACALGLERGAEIALGYADECKAEAYAPDLTGGELSVLRVRERILTAAALARSAK